MSATPRLLIVRFAPWMTFRNAHPHDLMWPCMLLSAASVARALGWHAEVLDLHVEHLERDALVERIVDNHADIVLFDTMTPTSRLALDVGAAVKDRVPDLRLYGVGQHASEAADDLLGPDSPYDGVLLGEHEDTLSRILDGEEPTTVPGFGWFADGAVQRQGGKQELGDLDRLPPLEPRGLLLDQYQMRSVAVPRFGRVRWGYLLTSRGCPYPCTFCSPTLRQSYGRGFRGHSAERVVDDMARLHTDWGVDAFYTIDDVFTLHKGRVHEICERLIRKRLPIHWTIQTRADLVDADMCKALKAAGCTAVKMGIESGVPRILDLIEKRATRQEMLDAARAIRGAGLQLTAYYMLGHPTETLDEMHETIDYAWDIDADMIQVAFHTPYPGSATWEQYRERISDLRELNHYETQHLNASEVDNETLERLQRSFYLRYYFSPRIFSRYLRHRLLYRASDPTEWQLAFSTLRYLLGNRGLQDAGEAAS